MIGRMIGAALLNVHTYEEVERDVNATSQALIVVLLSSLAAGIALLPDDGIGGLIGGIVAAIISWILYAAVAYFVGKNLFGTSSTRATFGEVLRTLGFAQSPGVLRILAGIPVLGWLVSLIVWLWLLATTIVALRQSLDFTTGRAIGTAVVSWIVYFIPNAIIFWILT